MTSADDDQEHFLLLVLDRVHHIKGYNFGWKRLLGNGLGSFSPSRDFSVGHGPGNVALGYVDGDGKLDIVVPNAFDNDVSVLLNTSQ